MCSMGYITQVVLLSIFSLFIGLQPRKDEGFFFKFTSIYLIAWGWIGVVLWLRRICQQSYHCAHTESHHHSCVIVYQITANPDWVPLDKIPHVGSLSTSIWRAFYCEKSRDSLRRIHSRVVAGWGFREAQVSLRGGREPRKSEESHGVKTSQTAKENVSDVKQQHWEREREREREREGKKNNEQKKTMGSGGKKIQWRTDVCYVSTLDWGGGSAT